MKQGKTVYTCRECGYQSAKWLGRCPECGAWNTFEEETYSAPPKSAAARGSGRLTGTRAGESGWSAGAGPRRSKEGAAGSPAARGWA